MRHSKRRQRTQKADAGENLTAILRASYEPPPGSWSTQEWQACRRLIAACGSIRPSQLTSAQVFEAVAYITEAGYAPVTVQNYLKALRRVLRVLWQEHGAPKLDDYVKRPPTARPRNIVATDDEIGALITAARPHLKLWLMFCAHLGIRSGTALRLGWEHYDRQKKTLRFTTKFGSKQTLPALPEICKLIAWTDSANPECFVRQLHRRFGRASLRQEMPGRNAADNLYHIQLRELMRQLGITRKITPHDMRRRAAVRLYEHTGDIRKVQALLGHRHLSTTLWYLDHDATSVEVTDLEAIKPKERKTA